MNKKEFREINSLVFLGTFLTHDLHRTDHILNYKQQHIIIFSSSKNTQAHCLEAYLNFLIFMHRTLCSRSL